MESKNQKRLRPLLAGLKFLGSAGSAGAIPSGGRRAGAPAAAEETWKVQCHESLVRQWPSLPHGIYTRNTLLDQVWACFYKEVTGRPPALAGALWHSQLDLGLARLGAESSNSE